MTTFHAESEGIDPDRVIEHLLAAIPAAPSASQIACARCSDRFWFALAPPMLSV